MGVLCDGGEGRQRRFNKMKKHYATRQGKARKAKQRDRHITPQTLAHGRGHHGGMQAKNLQRSLLIGD